MIRIEGMVLSTTRSICLSRMAADIENLRVFAIDGIQGDEVPVLILDTVIAGGLKFLRDTARILFFLPPMPTPAHIPRNDIPGSLLVPAILLGNSNASLLASLGIPGSPSSAQVVR